LFFPRAGDTAYLEELERGGVRVVVVDPEEAMGRLFTVWTDAHDDGFLSAMHLIDRGHRRIALCADEPGWARQEEYVSGYRSALRAAGLDWDPALVAHEGWDHHAGYRATVRWLVSEDPPTAICFCCDTAALGGLAAAGELGFRVPEDLALVAYDDTDVAGWVQPPLTTLRERRSKLIEEACRLLVALIDGDEPSERERLLSTDLRIRRSSDNTVL
jgi:DNA-binding LacI/PurR family transcriptional regulator